MSCNTAGTKSLTPSVASVPTAEVCAESQDVVATSSSSNGGSSQHVECSEPEMVGMELEDVAQLQTTLLHSLQQLSHGEVSQLLMSTVPLHL